MLAHNLGPEPLLIYSLLFFMRKNKTKIITIIIITEFSSQKQIFVHVTVDCFVQLILRYKVDPNKDEGYIYYFSIRHNELYCQVCQNSNSKYLPSLSHNFQIFHAGGGFQLKKYAVHKWNQSSWFEKKKNSGPKLKLIKIYWGPIIWLWCSVSRVQVLLKFYFRYFWVQTKHIHNIIITITIKMGVSW
jgi:hypothetical protein